MEKLYFQQKILLAVNALKILMGKETETMGQNETFDVYVNFIFLHNLLPFAKRWTNYIALVEGGKISEEINP